MVKELYNKLSNTKSKPWKKNNNIDIFYQ